MSSRPSKKAESCSHDNCGSRRFHVGGDGYTYCARGHQQSERGTVIVEDTGELPVLGRKSRKQDSDGESVASRVSGLSRSEALEHYLLSVQLILRKQLRWLIDVQRFPAEIETLVRDLWTLRLRTIRHHKAFGPESGSDTDGGAISSRPVSSQSEGEGASTDVDASSNPNSHRSSSSSSRPRRNRSGEKDARSNKTPNLLDTLALLYTGVLLLRIPITVRDIHEWINSGKLLYYFAARKVPLAIRERLPGRYQEFLEPQDLLKPQSLHAAVLSTLDVFHAELGMSVPPINHQPMLFRWIRELALPLEAYAATKRLVPLLGLDYGFALSTRANRASAAMNVGLRYPEARLAACMLVAMKIFFPIEDSPRRQVESETDLAALAMDWEHWSDMFGDQDEPEPEPEGGVEGEGEGGNQPTPALTYQKSFQFTEDDALATSGSRLDDYMNWYEENIASEAIREHNPMIKDAEFRRSMFRLFPLEENRRLRGDGDAGGSAGSNADSSHSKVQSVQSRLSPRPVQGRRPRDYEDHTQEATVDRLGSFYRRTKRVEDLSGPTKVLFERVARVAGLPVEMMVHAVFLIEMKAMRYEEKLRKGKTKAEETDEEDDGQE